MTFVHHVRPRYAEVDMQRVVFNAHWLTYFDEANTLWWPWAGVELSGTFLDGFDAMLVKATVEWHGGAGWNDDVAIEVVPTRVGNASFDFAYRASVGERPVCSATLTYVSVDLDGAGGRSRPLPPRIRAVLEQHCGQSSQAR